MFLFISACFMHVPANFYMFHTCSCWFMHFLWMFLLIPECFIHVLINSCIFYACSCLFPFVSYMFLLIYADLKYVPANSCMFHTCSCSFPKTSRNKQEHVKNKKQEAGMCQESTRSKKNFQELWGITEKFPRIPRNHTKNSKETLMPVSSSFFIDCM